MYKIVKQILVGVILVSLTTLNSCKDKGSDTVPVSAAGQYLNLNNGSTWEYVTDNLPNTTLVTVVDSAMQLSAKNYKVFHSTTQGVTTSNYYAYKNGNYSLLKAKTGGGYEELVYLKDSSEVGKKWTSTISPSGTKYNYNYEVKENGLTKTINGITYSNVLHIYLSVLEIGYTADAYYAPKVGLIKNDVPNPGIGATTIMELKSYTLK